MKMPAFERDGDFKRRLGTSLVEDQSANAGHVGSCPGPGRFHVPGGN